MQILLAENQGYLIDMLKKNKNNKSGFTLLEVMIAITIMVIAFAAILSSQSSSINLTMKTKELNIAAWLAHNVMVESEHLYEGKPLEELPKEESESFPAPFNKYKWKREIKEVKFPDLSSFSTGKDGEGVPEPVRILTQAITKYLSKSLRELVVQVSWERGKGTQKIELSTYLVDLNAEFKFEI